MSRLRFVLRVTYDAPGLKFVYDMRDWRRAACAYILATPRGVLFNVTARSRRSPLDDERGDNPTAPMSIGSPSGLARRCYNSLGTVEADINPAILQPIACIDINSDRRAHKARPRERLSAPKMEQPAMSKPGA
jgi:hypothetical protein